MEFDQIGKYKIVEKIGQGAMGQVYRAHDPVLNRFVAVKTMTVGVGMDDELRRRFHREAQSAARLNHPNIITVYDFGEERGNAYMAMELLEGTDLKDLIGTRTLTTLAEKLDLMDQICEGLAFAHAMEVVHRDLKPANIHLQPNGQVKIMDFGLARLGSSDMTKSGMVMGTPNYMSPEQVRGEKADTRSDIFSLGAVFYELLSNHKPFNADSMHAVLFQVLQNDPEPVRKWVPDLPPLLVNLVEKALHKDPNERYQHAGEMMDAVREARNALAWDTAGAGAADSTSIGTLLDGSPTEPPVRAKTLLPRRRSRMEGSSALGLATAIKPAPGTVPGSRVPRTLSGRAPTQVDSASPAVVPPAPVPHTTLTPPPESPSRTPLYVGGGVAAAAVLALGVWLLVRAGMQPAPESRGESREQVGALTQQLVGSQVLLARKNLEDKDYKSAVAQAEGALRLDPGSAPAREILERARAILAELDGVAAEARQASEAGDSEKASRALARVLVLDPNHPVAGELSTRLNTQFRGQADDARQSARRAQGAAENARARSAPGFSDGLALVRDGDASVKKGEFAVATRKFLDARDSFDRARRGAEEKAAAVKPAATAAPTAMTSVATPTAPPVTAPAATLPPVTIPPATVPVVATAPPVTAPPPTAPPATAPVNDEPAIRKVVADYARAIEDKDLGLFRSLKPNLSAEEEQRLRTAFQAAASQRVSVTISGIQLAGAQATVKISRRDSVDGHSVTSQQTLVLAKGPGGWTIRDIGR